LHMKQEGTVIRLSGYGRDKKSLGGTWSTVSFSFAPQ
jgi:hypothetical protein